MCAMDALAAGTDLFGSCCSWCEPSRWKPLFWMKYRFLHKNTILSDFSHINRHCGFMENHLDPLKGQFLSHSSSDCLATAWPCLSSSGCWVIPQSIHALVQFRLTEHLVYSYACTKQKKKSSWNEGISRDPGDPVVDQADRASPPGWIKVCFTMSAPQGLLPGAPISASPQKVPTVGANVQDQTVADSTRGCLMLPSP